MYVAPRDSAILRSEEMFRLKAEYREKFSEGFIPFNYSDFHGTEITPAAQVYLDALRDAVNAEKPYRIVSHRYDDFDH